MSSSITSSAAMIRRAVELVAGDGVVVTMIFVLCFGSLFVDSRLSLPPG